jgi:ribosomal-protein-alanine N-acetyltransferase
MTLADVDEVLVIEQSVQPYPWTRGNFCDAIKSGYLCYVAEVDGELSSFAVLMPGVDEAELLNIGVAAAQQRRGRGRAMLESMLVLACDKHLSRVFLEVRAGNQAAIGLYRSVGFSEIGVRRGYYRNAQGSEDARVMARDISGKSNG